MRFRAPLVAAVVAGALSSWQGEALARSQLDVGWPRAQVFQVAVRFVRVDRGCKVVDKDAESAFVLFECSDEPAPSAPKGAPRTIRHGALELLMADVQGRDGTRLQVTLSDEPSYMELRFLELLERKIKDERGPVLPPPRAKEKPRAPVDAGDG